MHTHNYKCVCLLAFSATHILFKIDVFLSTATIQGLLIVDFSTTAGFTYRIVEAATTAPGVCMWHLKKLALTANPDVRVVAYRPTRTEACGR